MKEYKYIVYVFVVGVALPLRFDSGWWEDKAKAKAEMNAILESKLPSGLYDVSENLKERTVK